MISKSSTVGDGKKLTRGKIRMIKKSFTFPVRGWWEYHWKFSACVSIEYFSYNFHLLFVLEALIKGKGILKEIFLSHFPFLHFYDDKHITYHDPHFISHGNEKSLNPYHSCSSITSIGTKLTSNRVNQKHSRQQKKTLSAIAIVSGHVNLQLE